jgi:hypothetical protein
MIFGEKNSAVQRPKHIINVNVICRGNIITVDAFHNDDKVQTHGLFTPHMKYKYTWFDKFIRKITKVEKMKNIKTKHIQYWKLVFQEEDIKV